MNNGPPESLTEAIARLRKFITKFGTSTHPIVGTNCEPTLYNVSVIGYPWTRDGKWYVTIGTQCPRCGSEETDFQVKP